MERKARSGEEKISVVVQCLRKDFLGREGNKPGQGCNKGSLRLCSAPVSLMVLGNSGMLLLPAPPYFLFFSLSHISLLLSLHPYPRPSLHLSEE